MAGDPNAIADIFDVTVEFIPALAEGRFGFANPTFVSEFAENPSFMGRIKGYTGSRSQKLAALLADGFAANSDAYRQVEIANLQDGPARTMYVGRTDPTDLTWGAAISAIKAEADASGTIAFYAFTTATRDPVQIEAIADALEGDPEAPVFAFYLAQTDDENVRNDNPGNVARNILAKNYRRTALLWHDPANSSNYGSAVLQSTVTPLNIPHNSTIELRVDGGATQVFTFVATAASLLGANPETFAFADGDALLLALDNAAQQSIVFNTSAATVLSTLEETYAFVDGLTLAVRIDGGAAQTVTFNGTAGSVVTGAATFALADGETVTFDIDGSGNQVVTFNTADFVAIGAATAAELNAVYTAQLTGVNVSDDGSIVTVASQRLGSSSNVEIVAGTGGALAALGYAVGDNFGAGFAAFLDAATAAEVATEIVADTSDLTSVDDGGFVRITSAASGTASRVQVTGGSANGLLGFDTNEVAGGGDFVDASAATALEVVNKINASVPGGIASVGTGPDAGKVRLTSAQLGTGSKVDVSASTVQATLGLSTTAEEGTGDFVDASKATAGEIALVIGNTIADATASSASSRVKVISNSQGAAATVEAVGGSLLGTLLFADATTNVRNLATGTGVLEDFADSAWMGRCITFDLDAANGAALWDNQTLKAPSPTGAGTVSLAGDKDLADVRENLHETLRVNTYELRNGRNETHFGTLLNNQLGAGGYIDIRTTIDWLQARISEKFKSIDDAAADNKFKYPYLQSGVDVYAQGLEEVLDVSQTNGHTIFDGKPLDLNDEQATGIFVPTIAQQTQADINNRLIDGFQARQLVQGGIQRGRVLVQLIGPTAEAA